MNKLFIIGNLTRDPELRTMPDGRSVCNFTVAVNKRVKKGAHPEADFFRCTAWDALAENCGKYLAKGRKVNAVGPVSLAHYADQNGEIRYYLQMNAQDVEFLSPKDQGGEDAADAAAGYVQVEDEDGNF